jgi:RHS repeat-associated protein
MYDEAGNLVIRRDPDNFELKFSFDDDNRLWKVKQYEGDYELTLKLDDLGRPERLRDSSALGGSLEWVFEYEKVTDSGKKVLNLFKRSIPDIDLISEFDYDAKNRLSFKEYKWNGASPLQVFKQELTCRDDDLIAEIIGDDANRYNYDGIKQLVYEDAHKYFTDYDPAGNRLYLVDRTATDPPPENTYDNLNRLKDEEYLPATFSYDENGNLQKTDYPQQRILSFDGANRLRMIELGEHKINYLYDVEGKLVERTLIDKSGATVEQTRFHYLLSKPILVERDGQPLTLLTRDTSGILLRIRRYDREVGGPKYAKSLFPIYDGLGNPVRFVTDDHNEPIQISYDAWGNYQLRESVMGLFEFWGYKDGILDKMADQILFGARWYLPGIGRWISEDPSESPEVAQFRNSSNLYAYALNNPISFLDQTGLQEKKNTSDWESVTIWDPEWHSVEYGRWIYYEKYGGVTAQSIHEWKLWFGHKSAAPLVGNYLVTVVKGIIAALTGMASEGLTAAATTGPTQVVTSRGGELLLKGSIQMTIKAPTNVTMHVVEKSIRGEEPTLTSITEKATGLPLSAKELSKKIIKVGLQ